MALTAREIAAELTPVARAALAQRRADFIARAGGLLRREAASLLWPTIIAEVPTGLEWGLDAFLTRCGQLTVDDLLTMVVNHTISKGLRPHPSFLEKTMADYITQVRSLLTESVTDKVQRRLEENTDLAPGMFGAGPPVSVYSAAVPGIVVNVLEVMLHWGADEIMKNREPIEAFLVGHVESFITAAVAKLQDLHFGK